MNKKVLITGASRGIGEAIARKLAANHYDLFLTCKKSEKKLLDLAEHLENEYHVKVNAFLCDMSKSTDVDNLFREIDHLDILINNAGISHVGLLSEMTPEEWHRIIDVNLSSLFYTSKLAIPHMLSKQKGKIINISSVWGISGSSCEVVYSASKAGLVGFTKAMAKELAPSGITVNAVAPGLIETGMNSNISVEDLSAFVEEVAAANLTSKVTVSQTGCIGICQYEPVVEIYEADKKTTYVKMTPDKAKRVVEEHIKGGKVVTEYTFGNQNA